MESLSAFNCQHFGAYDDVDVDEMDDADNVDNMDDADNVDDMDDEDNVDEVDDSGDGNEDEEIGDYGRNDSDIDMLENEINHSDIVENNRVGTNKNNIKNSCSLDGFVLDSLVQRFGKTEILKHLVNVYQVDIHDIKRVGHFNQAFPADLRRKLKFY